MVATISQVYPEYMTNLLAGQRVACAAVVDALRKDDVPVDALYVNLFQASLYDVGGLWAANRISVATEHIASAITEGLLNRVFASLACRPRIGKTAVVAAIQPELHQIGGRMVADALELRGWDSLYVGGNTPVADLRRLIREKRPDLVAISLTMPVHQPVLQAALQEILGEFPTQRMVVGGQGLAMAPPTLPPQVRYVPSLDQFDVFLRPLEEA